jgi:signal peptidase I
MFGRSKQKDSSDDDYLLEQFAREEEVQEEGWFKSFFSFVGETVKVLVLAAAIILPIRYFLIQPFYVKGASMEPNFFDSEYLMINEISYRISDPTRGDITVFRYPRDPSQFFIKRVIGMPGERIEIRNNEVFIYDSAGNEIQLNENAYLADGTMTTVHGGQDSYELAIGEYFLLGDNRTHSLDSRNFGPVDENLIVGKVWFRGWPLDRIQVFE